ncbi:MAG TPA: type IV toxin-antitoxin system AbiEi family antitoxin [Chitinophagaceae bacterium]|nr:type IV toxin-antitoxin system AbiEi family antitoxin [Chitinophagaceae bacterium]
MASDSNYKRLEYWIEECQSKGKLAFSLQELKSSFENTSETSLKRMLDRISEKQKVVSIFKGYYVIIPPQYSSKGILPPAMFIDGLMKFLERKYYVALLNAAALHGASHQQPQEYFVVTEYPVLRATNKKGIKINYISTRELPTETLTEKRKTETGYLTISNPLLTAIDLIGYAKKIGGLNRAATVINDLTDAIKKSDVNDEAIKYATASSLQRLGFILEEILDKKELAEKIFLQSKKSGIKFYLIPLKASGEKNKNMINEKWKLIVNTEIEID